jgi:DNA-binding CsgD family transcriptional regulator
VFVCTSSSVHYGRAERAVAAIEAAIWQPAALPEALGAMADACSASMVTIVGSSHPGELSFSRDAHHAIDAYLHRREVPDSRQLRVNPRLDQGFRTDDDDFAPDEIAHDPYYQEFLAPLDVRWHAAAALPGMDGQPLVISIKRSPGRGRFEGCDIEALQALLPRLRCAARQAAVVARSRFAGELSAFERIGRAAFITDADARIVACNALTALGDGLLVDRRRLVATSSRARSALARAIAAAALRCQATAVPVVVGRPSAKAPYAIDVFPMPASAMSPPHSGLALVLVNDLADARVPGREALRAAFDLTDRESELAQLLARGRSLAQSAAAMGISPEHARQRLKTIFDKTATRSQSDLRALLVRLA